MQIQGQPDVAALNHQPQLDRETQRIVSLCLQRDRDSAIVQELRTERELLLKEREAIEKALQSVHRDLEEVASAEASLAETCQQTENQIAKLTDSDSEYERLRRVVNLVRIQTGWRPVETYQAALDAVQKKRLDEKRIASSSSPSSLADGSASASGSKRRKK